MSISFRCQPVIVDSKTRHYILDKCEIYRYSKYKQKRTKKNAEREGD